MATTACFPHRSIVIIGKKGAGKSTIGNCLSGTTEFPIGCILSNKESWTSHRSFVSQNGTSFSFYMIEELPPVLSKKSTLDDVPFPENISLVIFVFKYGCFTQEERDFFGTIIGFFNDNLRAISALVVTGCDDLSEDAKKTYEKKFRDAEAIAGVMGKGFYCVTLPDTTQIRPKFFKVYEKDIEESHQVMKQLLDSCSQTLPLVSLLKQQPTVNELSTSAKLMAHLRSCQIL